MKKKWRYGLWLLLILILGSGLIYSKTRFMIHSVSGTSMEAALDSGDRVLIDKKIPLKRYDIVAFSQKEIEGMLVKRIVGMPGDHLIKQGQMVVIDIGNQQAFENTIRIKVSPEVASQLPKNGRIPKGQYLVLGDHTDVSQDSRSFGYVKKTKIEGVMKVKLTEGK